MEHFTHSLGYSGLQRMLDHVGASHPDSYSIAPLYYQLTGRRGAAVYAGYGSCFLTCKHPHDEQARLVFPELGKNSRFELLARSLPILLAESSSEIRLARFTDEDLTKLRHQLVTLNTDLSIDVVSEDQLDWKFPVRILSTEKVASLQGNQFAKIRNKCRRAGTNIDAIPISCFSDLKPLRAALRFWEGTMILDGKDTPDMSHLYEHFFDISSDLPSSVNGLFFHRDQRPVGFSIWETVNSDTANLYVNVSDTTVTGISDYQLVSTCEHLWNKGVSYLNMGGSETASLDQFKYKYDPVENIDLKSAIVKSVAATSDNLKVYLLT